MPESKKEKLPSVAEKHPQLKESAFKAFFAKLKKRRIIETLAAFIGGGWLLVEVVERLFVEHYGFPKETIDITVVSVIGALLSILIWRWFSGTEKRPGNVKVEVLLVPLIILAAFSVDLIILLEIFGIPGKTLLIAAVAVGLGIAWTILKALQWAVAAPAIFSEPIQKPIESLNTLATKLEAIGPSQWSKSIVVLPFENISPEEGQEYFCDGMTEEIITDLSYIRDLRVISRNSAMLFKGTRKPTREIGRELNVQYVLEGSVRRAGNDLRITAQLIDAINDAHLWADKYSGTLDDVFVIQEKVSRSIVEALRLKLTQAEDRQLAKKPLLDIKAYECYLRARRAIYRFSDEGFEEAKRLLQAGLNIVGDNALLYAGLGYTHLASADIGMKPIETIDKAGEFAEKALRLDPETSTAYMVLGYVEMMHGHQRECIRLCKRALSIDPGDYDASVWLCMSLCFVGKMREVFPIAHRMIELDPLNPVSYWMETFGHFFEGRFVEAYDSLKRDPLGASLEVPVFRLWLAYSLAYAKRSREALDLLVQTNVTPTAEDFVLRSIPLFRAALQGDHLFMAEMTTPDLVAAADIDCMKAGFLMSFYAIVGDKDQTYRWLEAAVSRGLINYPFLNDYDPYLTDFRGDPRFKKLMERVKYEWEHFEE